MRKPFNTNENDAIALARRMNPGDSQRGLANFIVKNMQTNTLSVYNALKGRTEASVYSAIRRHDASTTPATV